MYQIKQLCYVYGEPGKEWIENLEFNPYFKTRDDAYNCACKLAEDEADYMNSMAVFPLTSFGAVEEPEHDQIKVNCYMLENKENTTGETEIISVYYVVEEDV